MDFNFNSSSSLDDITFDTQAKQLAARRFFSKVYLFMFGALLVTGAIAYQYGTPEFILEYFYRETPKGLAATPLFYVVVFSPLGIVFALHSLVNRASFAVLFALFTLYAVLLGFALTTIFMRYTTESIAIVFGISAGTFAIMAIAGYTTKVDLTRFGSILMMAFFGIFIASIVNFWVGSDGLSWLISIIGVLVFTGLTAYHMQNLKRYANDASLNEDQKNKLALLGGFTLYVTFINLFLSLLRLFGDSKN